MSISNRIQAVVVGLLVVAGPSASGAQDTEAQTAIVGCDLLTPPEPGALFLQFGDGFGDATSGIVLGIDPAPRSLQPDLQDVAGLSCSQVLAEVLARGFALEEFRTIGNNDATGIWYWQRSP